MCGIAGIIRTESQAPDQWGALADMSAAIAHRGPDDHGFFVSGPVGLAHRRLSIIDIVGGRQPMIDAERGRVLIYNGEIYNFQTLRGELEATGVRFTTRSDTEVLLRLAETSSYEWLRKVNGMFAFALWDEPSGRLLLGRDRLGIKPLYYAAFSDELVFASEIKALLRHPRVPRDVNTDRIPEYLAFRCIAGVETMFKGVYQVPPGHVLAVSQRDLAIEIVQFWSGAHAAATTDSIESPSGHLDQIQAVLTDSVRRQLVSDVPVGMYLSGGVDSSLITVLAKPFRRDEQLHTFSVGFEEEGFDESPYAHRVATQVGATHHALIVTESDYVNQLDETVRQIEEPLNHAHTVQLQLLSRYAKPFVTVVLTGEGADELFGGYPRLQIPLLAQRLRLVPELLSDALRHTAGLLGMRRIVKLLEASSNDADAVVHGARFMPRSDFERLYRGVTTFPARQQIYEELSQNGHDLVERILQFDQRTYLPSLLMRLDRTSMASAVECRVPFLDNEVIDCSTRVPPSLKIRPGGENKVALKKIAARLLPEDLVYRRKVGFGTPLAKWFRNPRGLGRYVDLLLDTSARARGYVDEGGVSSLVHAHRRGTDHSEAIWSLLGLELWCRTVIDGIDVRNDLASAGVLWNRELAAFRQVHLGSHPVEAFHSGMAV